MTTKTAIIRLGEADYTIRRFNLGELEELAALIQETPRHRTSFAIVRLALATAEPAVTDANAIDVEGDQITVAITTIMELSGLRSAKPGEVPGKAVEGLVLVKA